MEILSRAEREIQAKNNSDNQIEKDSTLAKRLINGHTIAIGIIVVIILVLLFIPLQSQSLLITRAICVTVGMLLAITLGVYKMTKPKI
jgi:hypothetical protein